MPRRKKTEVTEETTMSEETQTPEVDEKAEAIKAAFEAAMSADKSEDNVKMDMISAGASFKNVTQYFNKFMVESGRVASNEDKQKAVETACTENDVSTAEGFEAAVAYIMEAAKGVNDRSAGASIRGWCRKNDKECYKKPKAEGAGTRTTFTSNFYNELRANPSMSAEDADAYIKEHGSNNVVKHTSHYQSIRQLVNDIAAA